MANETSFEQQLLRLEEIVKRLEKGDASLEESLKLFEEGTALVRGCTKQLDEAEQKGLRLVKGPDGSPLEQPFETDE